MNEAEENSNLETNEDRWTCDFCGCITNSIHANPTACSICASRRQQIPAFLRRDDPLSAQLLRRTFFVRRGGSGALEFQRSFHQRTLEQMENDTMMDDENDHVMAALALEAAGVSDAARIPGARTRRELLMRSVEGIPFGLDAISTPLPPPEELLRIASENASLFNPHWESPITLGMHRKENSLVVSELECSNVATSPIGASDGKSIRTAQHIPRVGSRSGGAPLRRKTIGFRVAFNRPCREAGKSLGGGYLVGIATSSFSSFDERNSLQQSSQFWGIDDVGHKFEGGSTDRVSLRGSRRPRQGDEMGAYQATRNVDNALYGCLETVTVVVDLESRSLTFWRDGDLLGTLVKNLPRSGALYPVAVPFNAGSMVAITGVDGVPVASLLQHESFVKERKIEKGRARHHELCEQRTLYVTNGKPSTVLESALRHIFSLYKHYDSSEAQLGVTFAKRLWYRSGLKLKYLDRIIEEKVLKTNAIYANAIIVFDDYFKVICSIVAEDELFYNEFFNSNSGDKWKSPDDDHFEVGDVVELVEGYEKYGDASRGPMVAGDRGQVVEVQKGSNGERNSVRVLYSGRRWWYQPQTLLNEKSGLIVTPGVWFIQRILRLHGYDHETLTPLCGKSLKISSWAVGDYVIPATHLKPGAEVSCSNLDSVAEGACVGRIVPHSSVSGWQGIIPHRDAGVVAVEYVDSQFGLAVGIEESEGDERIARIHCVKVHDLVHAGFARVVDNGQVSNDIDVLSATSADTGPPSILRDVSSISKLDVHAIETVAKECDQSGGKLARVFTSGLAAAVQNAIAHARLIARTKEDQSSLLPGLSALGNLLIIVAKHLYSGIQGTILSSTTEGPNSCWSLLNESHRKSPEAESFICDMLGPLRCDGDSETQTVGESHSNCILLSPLSQTNDIARLAGEGRNPGVNQSSGVAEENQISALSLNSPYLHSIRRGGFEVLHIGEDGRRGAPILNVFTRSAIVNGILLNNFVWLYSVIETAKKKKGTTSTTSSIVNARDEDGLSLLALAVHFGCSPTIISYLIRNGATVDNELVRIAAYFGHASLLLNLLDEHIYVKGVVDYSACSEHIVETIEVALRRQNDQAMTLHREGEDFLFLAIRQLIRFGVECRNFLIPKRHIYKCITQILVGPVLLRALHRNRLKYTGSIIDLQDSSKSKSASNSESGRVNLFSDKDGIENDTECAPSTIASTEALLFTIPRGILIHRMFKHSKEASDCPLTEYLLLVEGLLWTKEVDDIAFGLSLTSLMLQIAPMHAVMLRRFGIYDLIAFHERECARQVDSLEECSEVLSMDSRRFSPHHVAAKEHEVKKLLSRGVVLCPKCHPAELHVTRHSSFRCDLCGNGVDRGFPMHGCRDCDWDACEACINAREGGIVKWKYVQRLSRECSHALVNLEKFENIETPTVTVFENDWSIQMISERIKTLDPDGLGELATMLSTPGSLTQFEFSRHILNVLRDALCGESSVGNVSPASQYDPPLKKRKPPLRVASVDVCNRPGFFEKFLMELILRPASKSVSRNAADLGCELSVAEVSTSREAKTPIKAAEAKTPEQSTWHTPELLRRLHDILSFFEQLPRSKVVLIGSNGTSDDLYSLTQPWTIEVIQFDKPFVLDCEPLMQLSVLKDHLLRATASTDASFVSYCESLVEDKAFFAECRKARSGISVVDFDEFRLGQFIDFDSKTGAHKVRYVNKIIATSPDCGRLELDPAVHNLSECFEYGCEEERIFIGCSSFTVLQRSLNCKRDEAQYFVQKLVKKQQLSEMKESSFPTTALPRGTRVERATMAHTIVGSSLSDASPSRSVIEYDLVSDSGDVVRGVPQHEISSGLGLDNQSTHARLHRDRAAASARDRSIRLLALRNLTSGEDAEQPVTTGTAVLKRRWSALSLLDEMSPVDLNACKLIDQVGTEKSSIKCFVDGVEIIIMTSAPCIENAPQFRFLFGVNDSAPTFDLGSSDMTVVCAFQHLSENSKPRETKRLRAEEKVALYFTFELITPDLSLDISAGQTRGYQFFGAAVRNAGCLTGRSESRRRDLHSTTRDGMEDRHTPLAWIDESESTTLSCMQVIDSIGRLVHESELVIWAGGCSEACDASVLKVVDASLESRSLTDKLSSELGQSLAVVGGALPSWCTELPSIAPRLFSYDSRRQLLERSAFGVSRATMRLQEVKVNVAPLRQRMAALRGRAVELVGEAFSGGAEDPTALQLQADELYGMEEALGARVNAAFKAQRWLERALKCAKAAVRRENLLHDAATVMERYASDSMIRQRRLEIRFSGESGFDAASGDEAGVTRGFYADVAEALISCQHVLCSTQSSTCSPVFTPSNLVIPRGADFDQPSLRLPLWIPDLDGNGKVVIPTPRASSRSTPGVFPRPLSPDDPKMEAVKEQFRFIGRVFASAIRERFMFPLPLSCSFLKLVQLLADGKGDAGVGNAFDSVKPSNLLEAVTLPLVEDDTTDDLSCDENSPTCETTWLSDVISECPRTQAYDLHVGLDSLDLPRPGFLGGEVYAIEQYVCKELDLIDAMNLSEEETANRYAQLASNPQFAQTAFGKSYECSFEEYIEGKTFVDPLDPSQGPLAMPLVANGHEREVNIFNIREWVQLAKKFILQDGVIEQAKAFRDGVNDFFPSVYLRLFTASELQRDVCGGSDNVDEWTEDDIKRLFKMDGAKGATEALVAVAAIGGEGGATLSRRFGSSSPTIGYLIKTLRNSTPTQRRQFLSFVTSVPIVTPGEIEVVPIVSPSGEFLPLGDSCLPRANTCARRLYLPKFESYESMASVLLSVIQEESKFKGFYEWRG